VVLHLGGVAIGNGLMDPVIQVRSHAASAYYSGLINKRQKSELEKVQWEAIADQNEEVERGNRC
jgi:vitellogenic carboxypeptidase-like protein